MKERPRPQAPRQSAAGCDSVNAKITLAEMRERVAKMIFGDDWIGDLKDEEYDLLEKHGPKNRNIQRADRSTIRLPHIARYPERGSRKLDLALGKQVRLDAQLTTVDTWIQDNNFPVDPREPGDRAKFDEALGKTSIKVSSGRRGPKPKILLQVMERIENQLAAGALTVDKLRSLSEKEMEHRFRAKRERCREARKQVLVRTT
jgi:hypothetical protein